MNIENAQKIEVQDIERYRKRVISCLKEDYHMSDMEAIRSVRSTHFHEILQENPEVVMSYPIKLWAGYAYSVAMNVDKMWIRLESIQ